MTAPSHVQSAQSNGGSSCTSTLSAATANRLLVAFAVARGASTMTGPSGFTLIGAAQTPGITTMYSRLWWKRAVGGETALSVSHPGDLVWFTVEEYDLLHPVLDQHNEAAPTGGTVTNPSITPFAGVPAVLIAATGTNPNYEPAVPSGYTERSYINGGTTPRITLSLADKLVDPTSGSYSGSWVTNDGGSQWGLHAASFYSVPPKGGDRAFII